jgi:hypothetical protein
MYSFISIVFVTGSKNPQVPFGAWGFFIIGRLELVRAFRTAKCGVRKHAKHAGGSSLSGGATANTLKPSPFRLTPQGAVFMWVGCKFKMEEYAYQQHADVHKVLGAPMIEIHSSFARSQPNLEIEAGTWTWRGGAHPTIFSKAVTSEHLANFAEIAGIEMLLINKNMCFTEFKKELPWNEVYCYLFRQPIKAAYKGHSSKVNCVRRSFCELAMLVSMPAALLFSITCLLIS